MHQSLIRPQRSGWRTLDLPRLIFIFGVAAIAIPTMYDVARLTWTTEQGGHAPIILATGLWLLWREGRGVEIRPPAGWLSIVLLLPLLVVFGIARITGILEIEAFVMYGCLVLAAYSLVGGAMIRALWFPLLYLALALPPPDSVVAALTQPIKIAISDAAVQVLHILGYPIASLGVMIQIANYQLLVAAACAGLNSIITLSAICLFYAYLRHKSDWVGFVIVSVFILPIAIFSNFVRVLILILVTYYLGEAAGQGFLHDFAGLTVFAVSIVTIFAIDSLASNLRGRRGKQQ
ncbi:MAG: exosortase V [Sphingomonas bacterium]|nr:exosortase V [Sphingomonas bacterium]